MLLRLELARWGKCLLKCSFTPVSSHLLLTLLFSSGSAVQQTSDTIVRGNKEVLLSCFQQKTTFTYMYWYKQERKKDSQLQLVAFSVEGSRGSDAIQKEFEGRFESSGMNGYAFNLTLKDAKPNDTGTYFCAKQDQTANTDPLHFGAGTKLTVLGPDQDVSPPQVTVFAPPKQEVDEKEKATIVCLVTDFYPDHVALSWTVNNKTRTAGVKTEDPVYDNTTERYSMTSRLRITKEEWQNSDNKFVCRVSFHGTEGSTDYEDDINGADCGGGSKAARESYLTEANLGKLVYILLVFKSTLYGAFVMGLKLRKKLAP